MKVSMDRFDATERPPLVSERLKEERFAEAVAEEMRSPMPMPTPIAHLPPGDGGGAESKM